MKRGLQYWRKLEIIRNYETLNSLGINMNMIKDMEQTCRILWEESWNSQESQNKKGIAVSLNNLGNVISNLNYSKTYKLYEERIWQSGVREGDVLGIGITLNNLGILAYEQGEYSKAYDLPTSLQIRSGLETETGYYFITESKKCSL